MFSGHGHSYLAPDQTSPFEVTALFLHGQFSMSLLVLYRKGQEVAMAGTTCRLACGIVTMKGTGPHQR